MDSSVKKAIKEWAVGRIPGIEMLMVLRRKKQIERFEEAQGIPTLAREFVARYGLQVRHGPFAGMQYVERAVGSSFVPKLLGSYEKELHPIVAQIAHRDYVSILDIGCAEGYYAIGLARLFPQTSVYAFDIDALGRQLCREMAELNNVSHRIHIGEACHSEDLKRLLPADASQSSLVVCDCEGYEYILLQLAEVPALKNADILVELHPDAKGTPIPEAAQRFLADFTDTHEIQIIGIAPRDQTKYEELQSLTPAQQQTALNEFRRGDQQWAFLQPKGRYETTMPGENIP